MQCRSCARACCSNGSGARGSLVGIAHRHCRAAAATGSACIRCVQRAVCCVSLPVYPRALHYARRFRTRCTCPQPQCGCKGCTRTHSTCTCQHEFAKRKRAIDAQFRGRLGGVEVGAGLAGSGEGPLLAGARRASMTAGFADNENVGKVLVTMMGKMLLPAASLLNTSPLTPDSP